MTSSTDKRIPAYIKKKIHDLHPRYVGLGLIIRVSFLFLPVYLFCKIKTWKNVHVIFLLCNCNEIKQLLKVKLTYTMTFSKMFIDSL